MDEKINVEINGSDYEIEVSKLICVIDSIDPAFGKIAARRMKRGKISDVLNVLITCEMEHEINIEDVTDEMKEEYVKTHFVAEVATEEQEEPTEVEQAEDETEGDKTNMTYYKSIYDYVQDADLSYYEISDGTIRETPFVEEVKPALDPDFVISFDSVEHEGKWYVHVNFGENDESWLLESELYKTVYLVYTEQSTGHYVTDGRVYETEDEAKTPF